VENKPSDLTAAPDKKPEQIEREMAQTRESLTQKVAALENTVVGTIQTATETVSGTVEQVKSAVQETVSTVKETVKDSVSAVADTVKEALNFSDHVRARPWLAVGLSAAAGFLTGYLTGGVSAPRPFRRSLGATRDTPLVPPHAPPAPQPVAAAHREPEQPGMFERLFDRVSRELGQVAESALSTALSSLKQNVSTQVPKLVDHAVAEVMPAGVASPGPADRRADGPEYLRG
jgi:ElaB/YqjD/DUF883 family membrane-anchored ribosome-binding protein